MSKARRLSKKTKEIMKTDMFASVAMVSLLLNLFLLIGAVLFLATNRLDEAAYRAAYSNLCDQNYYKNLEDRQAEAVNPKQAKATFDAYCRTGDLTEYFDEAVNSYLTDQGFNK